MMMLFNVVHRKVHKNMTKKGPLPVVVLRSKSSFRFPLMPFYCFMSQMSLWIMSQVMSQISISLHNMRFISHARQTLSEARDEGRRKINKCFIFSSPSPALRAKCRVGLAWVIKRLLMQARSALNSEPLFGFLRRSFSSRVFHRFGDFVINTHTECL